MLASGAHNLLACCRAVVRAHFPSQENFLELVHPGVDEQQRWIFGRNQRRALHYRMTAIFEVLQKETSYVITVHETVPVPLVYLPRDIPNGSKDERDVPHPVSP